MIVSHDAAATSIADRILVVRDGRVVEEARPGRPRSLVVARGWLRLPEALLRDAGGPGLVTAEALDGSIVLHPGAATERPAGGPSRAAAGDGGAAGRGGARRGRQAAAARGSSSTA